MAAEEPPAPAWWLTFQNGDQVAFVGSAESMADNLGTREPSNNLTTWEPAGALTAAARALAVPAEDGATSHGQHSRFHAPLCMF